MVRQLRRSGLSILAQPLRRQRRPPGFTFAQFSDPQVGFQDPPDPLGTKAFLCG